MTWNFTRANRSRKRDLTGTVIGPYTVIGEAPSLGHGARWRVQCACGHETIKRTTDVKKYATEPATCAGRCGKGARA